MRSPSLFVTIAKSFPKIPLDELVIQLLPGPLFVTFSYVSHPSYVCRFSNERPVEASVTYVPSGVKPPAIDHEP